MPNLGGAKYTLTVAGDKFKQGMTQAKGHAERTTKSIGASFGRAQAKIQGTVSKVPLVGSSLASLVTPAGLATAAIGLVVGGMAKMVSKTLDVGRRLGELREKLGVNAEAIQIYERAIEEGNGKTAAFEKTTLRLQKTIGDAAGGNKAAAEQFDALGLSFEDLANKSPEEALRAVLGAANDTLGPTDRASVLAATLGRSYADLGGFATKGAAELDELLASVKDTAVTMSGEGVTAVDEYDAANRSMRDSFGSIVTEVGMALIPTITKLFGVIRQLMPIIKVLISVGLLPVKTAVEGISGAVNVISALLRGDFTGALNHARNYFVSVATVILETAAKVIGLFNKGMADSIRGVAADLKALEVVAEEETAPALDKVTTTAGKTTEALGATSKAVETLTSTSRTGAQVIADLAVKQLDAKSAAELLRSELGSTTTAMHLLSTATGEVYQETKHAIDWIKEYEIRMLGARKETDMFRLSLGRLRTGYSNLPPSGTGGGGGGRGDDDDGGKRGRNRPGGRPVSNRTRDQIAKDPIIDVFTDRAGTPHSYSTAPGDQFSIDQWGRMAEAIAWLAANRPAAIPAAQHGAFVRGSRMGSLVRVGENNRSEVILGADTFAKMSMGGGANGGGRRRYVIQIGEGNAGDTGVERSKRAGRRGQGIVMAFVSIKPTIHLGPLDANANIFTAPVPAEHPGRLIYAEIDEAFDVGRPQLPPRQANASIAFRDTRAAYEQRRLQSDYLLVIMDTDDNAAPVERFRGRIPQAASPGYRTWPDTGRRSGVGAFGSAYAARKT